MIVSIRRESQTPVKSDVAVEAHTVTWTQPVNAEAPLAKSEYSQSCRCLQRLGHFPGNTQAPKGPGLWSMKRLPQGDLLRLKNATGPLPPPSTALLKSTAARFSRLFDQQACLYIHKLTPPDLRSPALAYLLRMRNLRRSFWSVSELRVARRGSWLMKVRSKLEAELLSSGRFRQETCCCSPSWKLCNRW